MRIGFAFSTVALLFTSNPAFACDMDGMFGGRFSPFAAFAHRAPVDGAEIPTPINEPVESPTIARSDAETLPTPNALPAVDPKRFIAEKPATSAKPAG